MHLLQNLYFNKYTLPRMSACGSHFASLTLSGHPGMESWSHFHSTCCFSLEKAATNAFLLSSGILEPTRFDPRLKNITPYSASFINLSKS